MSSLLFYNKRDRLGLLIIVALLLVVFGVWCGYRWAKATVEPESRSMAEVDSSAIGQPVETTDLPSVQQKGTLSLHPFDPNLVSYGELVDMGIEPKLAVSLLRRRASGKIFRIPEDIMLTYDWDQMDWETLAPYVFISPQFQPPRYDYSTRNDSVSAIRRSRADQQVRDSIREANPYLKNKFTDFTLVDLNTADTTLLMRVPGIGPYYARRIVQRRAQLGGYVSPQQLLEINDFPESAIDWFTTSESALRRIYLPEADIKTLAKHPYIGYEKAKAIDTYQRLYGPVNTLDRLRQTGIFKEEEITNLLPYLRFDEPS